MYKETDTCALAPCFRSEESDNCLLAPCYEHKESLALLPDFRFGLEESHSPSLDLRIWSGKTPLHLLAFGLRLAERNFRLLALVFGLKRSNLAV